MAKRLTDVFHKKYRSKSRSAGIGFSNKGKMIHIPSGRTLKAGRYRKR